MGLRLQHIPHWHTYWRNPGDSGLPTTLNWTTLPPGVQPGEIAWPAPQRLPIGPLVNYGYEGDLLLPLDVAIPATARPGSTLRLTAEANWLVCNDVCIPENATLSIALPVAEAGVTPGQTALAPAFEPAAGSPPPARRPVLHVFPYTEQLVEPARHELYRTARGYALRMSLAANAVLPARFDGIACCWPSSAAWC
ncbi:protein-disulfide reductase DsbD domain-containing protein [Piscinibacter sakaiensis]|uniref:protein-disulfide reductase DsbD domain-containing protein n=1 Tax=Piscinibacter sakaiensis TaxID=1547922 RepID=UPI00372D6B30